MNPTTDQLKKLQEEITQGEWSLKKIKNKGAPDYAVFGANSEDGRIALIEDDSTTEPTDGVAANAQAIALVPEMIARILELEEALLAYVEQEEYAAPYSNSPMRIKARAALGGK